MNLRSVAAVKEAAVDAKAAQPRRNGRLQNPRVIAGSRPTKTKRAPTTILRKGARGVRQIALTGSGIVAPVAVAMATLH